MSLVTLSSFLCFSPGGVADTTEVAYAFGNAHEGVAHVLLVLEADTAGIVVLAQEADEEGEVDTPTTQLYTLVGLGGAGNVLQMDVEDAGVIATKVGKGVAAVAQVVADIEAHSHAGIAVLDMIPDIFSVGIHGHVGAMQVDGQTDVVLADFLLDVIQELVVGNTYQHLDTYALGVLEGSVHLGLRLHVDGSYTIACDAIFGQFLVEGSYLLVGTVEGEMEILDAEVVDIQLLHGLEGLLEVELMECPSGHAQMERFFSLGCLQGAVLLGSFGGINLCICP